MTGGDLRIRSLGAAEIDQHAADLCRVLIDSVADGAAIGFLAPLSPMDAARFWKTDVQAFVEAGDRHLLGAFQKDRLIGTVQLVVAMPLNQPHRAEIAKMIVHPDARRRGIGKALMGAALDLAREAGKTLLTLDTRTGDVSEHLYRAVGFEQAGIIPDYALDPDGTGFHATTYMFRRI